MKNLSFKILGSIVGILFLSSSCSFDNSQPRLNYDQLKEIPYSRMPILEKQLFKEELVLKLSENKYFIIQSNLLKEQSGFLKNKEINNNLKSSIKPNILNLKESETYFKNSGISNPKKFRETEVRILSCALIIARNFPEMKQLDKTTRKEIFLKAMKATTGDNQINK